MYRAIRTSMILGLVASSLAVASSASAATPIFGGTVNIGSPMPIFDAPKPYMHGWTVVDFSAKRDTALGSTLTDIHNAWKGIPHAITSAVNSPVSFDLPDIPLDADVNLNASGIAWAFPNPKGTSTMAITASTSATYLISVPGYNQSHGPAAEFEIKYTRAVAPGCTTPFCQVDSYYDASYALRGLLDSNYTNYVLIPRQANPLAGSKTFGSFSVLNTPNYHDVFGGVVSVDFSAQMAPDYSVVAAYSLDPTGGNVNIKAETTAIVNGWAAIGASLDFAGQHVGDANANPEFVINLLGSNMKKATVGASASLSGIQTAMGRSICASAQGYLDAGNVGSWDLDFVPTYKVASGNVQQLNEMSWGGGGTSVTIPAKALSDCYSF